jgi:hypothetical protein
LTAQTALTLIEPHAKTLAFHLYAFEDDSRFEALKHYNYYSIVIITEGRGKFRADLSAYSFESSSLICFSIYQPFMIRAEGGCKGIHSPGEYAVLLNISTRALNRLSRGHFNKTLTSLIQEQCDGFSPGLSGYGGVCEGNTIQRQPID